MEVSPFRYLTRMSEESHEDCTDCGSQHAG